MSLKRQLWAELQEPYCQALTCTSSIDYRTWTHEAAQWQTSTKSNSAFCCALCRVLHTVKIMENYAAQSPQSQKCICLYMSWSRGSVLNSVPCAATAAASWLSVSITLQTRNCVARCNSAQSIMTACSFPATVSPSHCTGVNKATQFLSSGLYWAWNHFLLIPHTISVQHHSRR